MRVPGGRGSLLEAKARGADVRMVYSLLDALELARRNPERDVIFFAIGFETTAPATAVTSSVPVPGVRNFSAFCNHVTMARRSGRSSTRPGCSSTRSLRRAVSTVIGTRPYDFIVSDYAKPVVVTAFEPIDILRDGDARPPAARGTLRGREPVHARCPPRRQPARPPRSRRRWSCATRSVAWAGWIERSASAAARAGRMGCRGSIRAAGHADRRPEGVPVRRGADRRDQAVGVQVWTACTPSDPSEPMVSSEGACAAYYNYGRLARRQDRPRLSETTEAPRRADHARPRRRRQATRALVESLSKAREPLLAPLDSALLVLNGSRLAFKRLVRRLPLSSRAATSAIRRQRRQRPRVSGARPIALGGLRHRGRVRRR